ncbi:3'-5' exoribonuclease domain-containing protein [Ensifer soli]|uniref:3'-5' exoribonuclease domain-containing protein n=1 Tax=Ciceribacter sp. sgz301302 TaxID=3342379 RepID=UPI0035B77961
MSASAHYFVTDVECDGPDPAQNSMLSFATVVVREDGTLCGEFEAVLTPRADRAANARTMEWWASEPEAWKAATENPEPPEAVMPRFAGWVESFPGRRCFAAKPVAFDGAWIDAYLRAYADSFVVDMPVWGRSIFTATPLDIGSYLIGVLGRTDPFYRDLPVPAEWFGDHPHSHRAIDDARGYACVLARLLGLARRTPHRDDFFSRRADRGSHGLPQTLTKES